MPNNVFNHIVVSGDPESVQAFMEKHIRTEGGFPRGETFLDFETVVPLPQSIKESGDAWSVAPYWGTKWNSYDFIWIDQKPERLEFRFATAWSWPTPIFEALAEQWPQLDIRFISADVDDFHFKAIVGNLSKGSVTMSEESVTREMFEKIGGREVSPEEWSDMLTMYKEGMVMEENIVSEDEQGNGTLLVVGGWLAAIGGLGALAYLKRKGE